MLALFAWLKSFFRFGSAKVRRLFDFPNFYLKTFGSVSSDLAACPVPFGLGVQKYGFILTMQILP